ncbi:related to tyrosinase precursor (monophenol monooxygenase) [Phialocephala subalpina]|uniref:Related to tyrosinase (Monophenol monooxygenase) n=1 Tax=Phialocephala subalpina TaxID=576137 RepID=A0A1L7XV02_9HELO|nr:related to tyrosinase precursor (monophenol monooxygenase) [Phialocephala subalpina]
MRRSFRVLYILTTICHSFQATSASPAGSEQRYPSYDYDIDRSAILKRQTSNFYAITGVHTGSGPNGSIPLQLEIRDLQKDPTTWTLYILGLDMLQYTPQTEMLSWYQIAGIHGRPFVAFDNVPPKPGNELNGYCSHVSILFPTWHRPYLALYEQVLYGMIQQIAQQYPAGPIRDRYVAAAANFRAPFWDWAAIPPDGQSVLPASVGGSPAVVVNGPAGTQTIANPLWSYRFQPLDPSQLPDPPASLTLSHRSRFLTIPSSTNFPRLSDIPPHGMHRLSPRTIWSLSSWTTMPHRFVAASTPSSQTIMTFHASHPLHCSSKRDANVLQYTTFSNEAWIKDNDPSSYDSIESIHDQIHGLTGSGGHMTYIDYSAFDPTFMLHHAMIDRIFAMWQILNPNSFVVPEPATYNTYTESVGQTQDINSPLRPFHQTVTGDFWTSASARSTESFGYVYPETVLGSSINVTNQVIVAINTLYGPTATSLANLKARNLATRQSQDSATMHTEWIANIRVQKYALKAPFFVHIFVGPFNPDPFSWSFEPNLAGTQAIFVKAASSMPATCNCDLDQVVAATIPLTDSLAENIASGNLKSMDASDVAAFLAQNLKYRVSLFNDTGVRNEDVPSLKVSVVSMDVETPESDSKLPVWKEVKGHMDVSMGAD